MDPTLPPDAPSQDMTHDGPIEPLELDEETHQAILSDVSAAEINLNALADENLVFLFVIPAVIRTSGHEVDEIHIIARSFELRKANFVQDTGLVKKCMEAYNSRRYGSLRSMDALSFQDTTHDEPIDPLDEETHNAIQSDVAAKEVNLNTADERVTCFFVLGAVIKTGGDEMNQALLQSEFFRIYNLLEDTALVKKCLEAYKSRRYGSLRLLDAIRAPPYAPSYRVQYDEPAFVVDQATVEGQSLPPLPSSKPLHSSSFSLSTVIN
ncbi:hypothetical protein GALMADRAFT_571330 [Galerina marginata CBS 339.88]|uniref:Uncharacterized protein n=1 Tax=Galerina marginata (strain CBS 339.88) TaxID=685588 RepID=A0A067T2P8_GALM3|nr:hypothetical protein GALMADRAFT_571330 [Galerina marginata CBS 339.88]